MYEKNIIVAIVIVLALSVIAIFFFMNKSSLAPDVATSGGASINPSGTSVGSDANGNVDPAKPDDTPTKTEVPATSPAPKTISLPSGLQYQDLKLGDGAVAKSGQSVSVNYIGVLTDGTKFDSSFDAGKPFTFSLGAGQVIKGWDEGVAGMKVGGRRILIIPANLGYGGQAVGSIPANSTLIFQVDLLEVK